MSTPSEPDQSADVRSLLQVDLGASADGTAGQATGRRIGGAVLMIVSGALTLAFLALWVTGWALPGFGDWYDIVGEFFPAAAGACFVLAALGFELLRRARKRRGAMTPQATALVGALDVLSRLEGPDAPDPVAQATPEPLRTGTDDTRSAGGRPGPFTTETRL